MSAPPPLSHHEILVLADPFARAGLQVDLAATNRAARTVVFKPVELPAAGPTTRHCACCCNWKATAPAPAA